MTPEHPDHESAGERTDDLSAELAPLSGEPRGESWPLFEAATVGPPDRAMPAEDDRYEEGGHGLSPLKLVLVVGALAIVTFGGIVAGRAVKPSAPKAASVTVTTTTRPAPVRKPRRAAVTRWGPLTVKAVGRFAPGAARAAAAVAGTKLVVAGGVGSDRVLAGPAEGHLRQVATLPGKRAAAAAFTLSGSVYVLGGEAGTIPTAQIVRIDPATGHAVAAGAFEEPLAEAGVAVHGGVVYIVGGWTGQKYATAVLRYTPGAAASLVARLPEGVRSPAIAFVGATLVVAGGMTEHGLSRQVYAIDLASKAVKVLATLPQALDRAALLAVGPKLYLLGGMSAAGSPVTTVVRIDQSAGRATVAGTMPKPLADAAAVHAGSDALLVDTHSGVVYRIG